MKTKTTKRKAIDLKKAFAESKPPKIKNADKLEAIETARKSFAEWLTFTVYFIQHCRALGESHKDKEADYMIQQFAKLHPVLSDSIVKLAHTIDFSAAGMESHLQRAS